MLPAPDPQSLFTHKIFCFDLHLKTKTSGFSQESSSNSKQKKTTFTNVYNSITTLKVNTTPQSLNWFLSRFYGFLMFPLCPASGLAWELIVVVFSTTAPSPGLPKMFKILLKESRPWTVYFGPPSCDAENWGFNMPSSQTFLRFHACKLSPKKTAIEKEKNKELWQRISKKKPLKILCRAAATARTLSRSGAWHYVDWVRVKELWARSIDGSPRS